MEGLHSCHVNKLKSLFVLPAISWERVTEFYYEHRENLDLSQIRNSADRKKFNQYLKYLEKYYVGSTKSNFPPRTWAGLIDKADIRYSNNGLESFFRREDEEDRQEEARRQQHRRSRRSGMWSLK